MTTNMSENKTRIVVCKKCGIRTGHEWQQWERRSLLGKLTGRVQIEEGWVCKKCGHRNPIQRKSLTKNK